MKGSRNLRATGSHFVLERQLRPKEELARELDADWFIHVDADELRLPPTGKGRLVDALAECTFSMTAEAASMVPRASCRRQARHDRRPCAVRVAELV